MILAIDATLEAVLWYFYMQALSNVGGRARRKRDSLWEKPHPAFY
jgi:hypothetical protein